MRFAWLDRARQRTDMIAVSLPLASGPGVYLRLSMAHGELQVVGRGPFISWEDAGLPPGRPVVLSIHGQGVVHRRVPERSGDDAQAFASAFPAVGEHALMATVVRSGEAVFIDAARSAQVAALIAAAHKAGHHVVDVLLGTSVVGLLHGAAGAPAQMRLPGAVLSFSRQGLVSVAAERTESEDLELGGDRFDGPSLHAFAAAYAFVTGGHGTAGRVPDELGAGRREERDRKRYRSVVRTALIAAAILLIGLSVLRRSVDRRYEEVTRALLNDQGRSERRAGLLAAVSEKEAIIRGSGLDEPLHAAYKADRIASLVPSGITLDRLVIGMGGSGAAGKGVDRIGPDTVLVRGHLADPVQLNVFITALEREAAFQGARLRSVAPAGRDGSAKFEIVVRMR